MKKLSLYTFICFAAALLLISTATKMFAQVSTNKELCKLMSTMGAKTIKVDEHGTTYQDGTIEFAFDNCPPMKFIDDKRKRYFKINHPMPKVKVPTKVVFMTPQLKSAKVQIPSFTAVPKDNRKGEHGAEITSYVVETFSGYPGKYHFEFELHKIISSWIENLTGLYDGSEHHIYGEIELFGIKFKNDSAKPLIFKITDGNYIYVSGIGTAKTEEGVLIKFGK
jgi:hypothetical protein